MGVLYIIPHWKPGRESLLTRCAMHSAKLGLVIVNVETFVSVHISYDIIGDQAEGCIGVKCQSSYFNPNLRAKVNWVEHWLAGVFIGNPDINWIRFCLPEAPPS